MEYRELEFTRGDDPVLGEIAGLLSTEWKGFSATSLHSKYVGNPHALPGTAHFICVYDGGRLVAANGYIPSRFRMGNKTLLGVQDCDSFVRAECRGKGIFSALVRRAEDYFSRQGYDFLYGFPNEFSRGAYEKLGWETLREIGYVGKPCFQRAGGASFPAREGRVHIERIPIEAAASLEDHGEDEMGLDLDPEYATWRFPASRGDYAAYLATDPSGQCAHAITAYDAESQALRICSLGGASLEARIFLLRSLGRVSGRKVSRIQACASPNAEEARGYSRAGFLPPSLMRLIKRSSSLLIRKPLTVPGGVSDKAWRIQYADYDTI